ncbi:nucleoporin p58/p45 [Cryptococcus neoformans AD2-60a]|nr:nucleoporin p58/p45 [Cryptococcus neoformans var. grubii AD2-60a]
MSFGGFKFGNPSTTAPATGSAPAASSPFSFGNTSTSTAQPAAGTSSTGGGLFGGFGQNQQQQPQQPAAGGSSLFGSFGAKPAAPAAGTTGAGGGLFGGASGQQQQPPPASGGLFGSTTQPQQQTQQTGNGLFGSTTQPQQQQQQTSGLFGSTTQPAQPSGGLFGSTAQRPAGTGLFGSTTQPTQQSTGTGLFGSTTQPQQSTGTGLFGSTAQTVQQPANAGLFGSTTQQQKPSTSLFGQSTAQLGGSSLFGQTTQPAQNPQQELKTSANPGTNIGADKTTKFSDLPEAAQKYIEQLDVAIKNQKSIASTLQTEPLGRAIWQTSLDVKSATEEYSSISHTLKSLKNSISQLRDKMIDQSRDIERIKEIWDIYTSGEGRMGQIRLGAYKEFPHEFFSKIANSMEERVTRYKKTITQLNRVVASLSSDSQASSPQVIVQTINNHQQAILAVAAQLDQLQVRMNGLKAEFTAGWRDKTGSVRDPFEMAREERNVKV